MQGLTESGTQRLLRGSCQLGAEFQRAAEGPGRLLRDQGRDEGSLDSGETCFVVVYSSLRRGVRITRLWWSLGPGSQASHSPPQEGLSQPTRNGSRK